MWKTVGELTGAGGGIGGATSISIHPFNPYFGQPTNSGPYPSAFLIAVILTKSVCISVSDNINGAYSFLDFATQGDGNGDFSIWQIGPIDYPVASAITVTATVQAAADTSTIGQVIILIPGVGDIPYTGGSPWGSATGVGTGNNSPTNIDLPFYMPSSSLQYIWTAGSSHTTGRADSGGGGVGTGGDIAGLASYFGNTLISGSWVLENSALWCPVTPVGAGNRDANYTFTPDPANLPGTYYWAAIAYVFSPPTPSVLYTKSLTGAVSFSGNMTPQFIPFLTTLPVVSRSRPLARAQSRISPLAQHRYTAILQSRYQPLKAVQRTTTQLDSVPKDIDVAVTETYPYQVDVSNYLAVGETVSSIVSVLTFMSTGAIVTSAWQTSVTSSGNVIQVVINAPVLQLGQQYQLATTFTAVAGKRLTVLSQLNIVA